MNSTLAAGLAKALLVERSAFDKGRSAAFTKAFGRERRGQAQAARADGNTRNSGEWLLTNAAVVREECVEPDSGSFAKTG
ncbi:MAG TPA: hypothetical protein VKX25_03975 [Bryobacteraceae bacterium]|nr:hypothetical protein [Bryobacteraceae bacterium]